MAELRASLVEGHNEGKKVGIIWLLCGFCAFVVFRNMTYFMTFVGWSRILLLLTGSIPLLFSVLLTPAIMMGLMNYFAYGYFAMGYHG